MVRLDWVRVVRRSCASLSITGILAQTRLKFSGRELNSWESQPQIDSKIFIDFLYTDGIHVERF